MKAKPGPKARVVAPYNYQNDPVSHGVPGMSKGPSLPVTRKNTTVSTDESANKRKTEIDWSEGADQPLTDLARQMKDLKGFKQADRMSVEMAGWKKNPVRQDCNEAWGRFQGQQEG